MNYTQSITRRHRTAFVLAIDQSGSMVEELKFRGQRISKAAAVAEVANSLLSELLLRATREGEVRDYYDIAVIGYSGEGVRSLLSADEAFVPVPRSKTPRATRVGSASNAACPTDSPPSTR